MGTSRRGEEEEGNYHQAVGEVNFRPVEVGEETHYPSVEGAFRRNSFLGRNWEGVLKREEDQRRTFLPKDLVVVRGLGTLTGLEEGVLQVVALPTVRQFSTHN